MSDGRAKTSAKNGAKGGRPVSDATLKAQAARLYIARETEKRLSSIVAKAINDAELGDRHARQWLSDQGWGKAVQPLTGALDQPLFNNEDHQAAQAAVAEYLADIGEPGDDED